MADHKFLRILASSVHILYSNALSEKLSGTDVIIWLTADCDQRTNNKVARTSLVDQLLSAYLKNRVSVSIYWKIEYQAHLWEYALTQLAP